MSAGLIALIAVVGGLGAVARFVVDGEVSARAGGRFPWGTLLINLTGSLALGVLTGLLVRHHLGADPKAVLGTGFCGGFTTFSTASVEAVRLARAGRLRAALANVVASAAGTVAAAAVGYVLVTST